jgi:hypothetical protein
MFSNLSLPKPGRTRRKSYAGLGTQPASKLYNIPDNDKAIDFHQEQKLMKEHLEKRRSSVPARPSVSLWISLNKDVETESRKHVKDYFFPLHCCDSHAVENAQLLPSPISEHSAARN